MKSLIFCVLEYLRALDIHPVFFGAVKDGCGKFVTEIFRAIAEICLGGTHVGGVRHGVFAAFGQTEH